MFENGVFGPKRGNNKKYIIIQKTSITDTNLHPIFYKRKIIS
jgi:hypothetical protein